MRVNLTGRLVIAGFFLWLIPFILAIPLYQWLGEARIVFKSIMALVLVLTTAGVWIGYLRPVQAGWMDHAYRASVVWPLISVVLDIPTFVLGFSMAASVYFSEIATSYLMIPPLVLCSAWLLNQKR